MKLKLKYQCKIFYHTVSFGEIATLEHEILDDSVEFGLLVSFTLFLLGQFQEVLDGFRHSFAEQTDFDTTGRFTSNGDIEPNLIGHFWA